MTVTKWLRFWITLGGTDIIRKYDCFADEEDNNDDTPRKGGIMIEQKLNMKAIPVYESRIKGPVRKVKVVLLGLVSVAFMSLGWLGIIVAIVVFFVDPIMGLKLGLAAFLLFFISSKCGARIMRLNDPLSEEEREEFYEELKRNSHERSEWEETLRLLVRDNTLDVLLGRSSLRAANERYFGCSIRQLQRKIEALETLGQEAN